MPFVSIQGFYVCASKGLAGELGGVFDVPLVAGRVGMRARQAREVATTGVTGISLGWALRWAQIIIRGSKKLAGPFWRPLQTGVIHTAVEGAHRCKKNGLFVSSFVGVGNG
jgi:hypothetical protein